MANAILNFHFDFLTPSFSRDSEDEMRSRFVFELVIWPQEVTLARWTQPSGPLCLWQCFQLSLLIRSFGSIWRDLEAWDIMIHTQNLSIPANFQNILQTFFWSTTWHAEHFWNDQPKLLRIVECLYSEAGISICPVPVSWGTTKN